MDRENRMAHHDAFVFNVQFQCAILWASWEHQETLCPKPFHLNTYFQYGFDLELNFDFPYSFHPFLRLAILSNQFSLPNEKSFRFIFPTSHSITPSQILSSQFPSPQSLPPDSETSEIKPSRKISLDFISPTNIFHESGWNTSSFLTSINKGPTMRSFFTMLFPILCGSLLLLGSGCEQLDLSFPGSPFGLFSDAKEKEEENKIDEDEFDTKLKTRLLGEYTTIAGLNSIELHGVGLVTGLNNTGGDPPPTAARTQLLNDMRKIGVKNPNRVLHSKSTALVKVIAHLPPLIKKGETFDIQVYLPAGSEATSLSGGWLLETHLSEHAIVPGKGMLEGHILAKASGPILLSSAHALPKSEDVKDPYLRAGQIIAGGTSTKDRNLALYLRSDYRMARTSSRVAKRIGARFHHYNAYGSREPLAEEKTDQIIELKLHPRYKDNFARYLQVIRSIVSYETPVTRRVRLERLQEEINKPETAASAALQLEAIGRDMIPLLKSVLKNPLLECRFHAACALAYLGDPAGLKVLADAAENEPAFRIYAFAAIAASEEAEANLLLREMLDSEVAEVRYGAFRALTVLDPHDPYIRGIPMGSKGKGMFMLHRLDVQGPPAIHLTHHRKSELVLFGRHLKFKTPVTLRAGNHIMLTAQTGSDTVKISRFQLGKEDRQKEVPNDIAAVIAAVTEFDGNYPDISMMLLQAAEQHNLPGVLMIDSLPKAGRMYQRPNSGNKSGKRTRVGSKYLVPNLYSVDPDSDSKDEFDREINSPKSQDEPEGEPSENSQFTNVSDSPQNTSSKEQSKITQAAYQESGSVEKSSSVVTADMKTESPPAQPEESEPLEAENRTEQEKPSRSVFSFFRRDK